MARVMAIYSIDKNNFLLILAFLILSLSTYIVIINLLYTLLIILCSMNVPSILRLIVTLFEIRSDLVSSLQSIRHPMSNLRTSSPKPQAETFSSFPMQVGHYGSPCANLRGSIDTIKSAHFQDSKLHEISHGIITITLGITINL